MSDNDAELQLKVWKELAISKQVLMRAATDALKLDPNCSQEELKKALDIAIKRAIEADVDISRAQEQAKVAISLMEKKLADSNKAQDATEAANAELLAAQEKLKKQLIDDRNSSAKEVKKLQESIVEKDRALKAINTALSDTPENILKKLKTLKKQKIDESNARKQAEKSIVSLRKEKQAEQEEAAEPVEE